MSSSDNVLDFNLARKRRHARQMAQAQALWSLYAHGLGVSMYQPVAVLSAGETQ